MKAVKQIKASGEIINLNGEAGTLEQAQAYVGGLIENAYTSPDRKLTIFVNEEGLLEELPYNALTSALVGGHIVGDALIVENEQKDFE